MSRSVSSARSSCASGRYIELYEHITGRKFVYPENDGSDRSEAMKKRVAEWLEKNPAKQQ